MSEGQQFGINIKEVNGELIVGIHTPTFTALLSTITNERDWANLKIVPNESPRGKAGYTHRIVVKKKAA